MIKALVLTQGELARELLAAARRIVGDSDRLAALSLGWDEDFAHARERTRLAIEALAPAHGLLILTDLFGGTPHNVAVTFRRPGAVEVVAGVNLPMVVRLGCLEGEDVQSVGELARWIQGKGRRSICLGEPSPPENGGRPAVAGRTRQEPDGRT